MRRVCRFNVQGNAGGRPSGRCSGSRCAPPRSSLDRTMAEIFQKQDSMANILLLHGLAGSAHSTWAPPGWLDILSEEGHQVLAPDLLGHGDAPKPHDPQEYRDLARWVRQFVDEQARFGVPCVGVGFSLGARVLLEWALQEPDRFSGLVLLGIGDNAFVRSDASPLVDQLRGSAGQPIGSAPSAFVQHLVEIIERDAPDPLAIAALLEAQADSAIAPSDLAGLETPVLIGFGANDTVGNPEPLRRALPHARVQMIHRCDHFATPSRFETMDAVIRFVDELERLPGGPA